ncbi:unnamed protein product [Prorocentrum cordatum]|uniref:Uncharacterized protein n=1 Tax=Prorocentrum cordatum TaxID=2364126 RepID=A0ABN9R6P6_9DINO|nr:unnamed protein product [Polarella glacialis]
MSLLAAEFRGKADFLLVGCTENHTSDDIPFGKNNGFPGADGENNGRWNIPQPKTLQERIDSVASFYSDFSDYLVSTGEPKLDIPWVVDGMGNEVGDTYRAYPFRNYVVKDGVVVFQGGHGPMAQVTDHIKACLETETSP